MTVFNNHILEALLNQKNVTDLCINGPDSIWVDIGQGMQRVDTGNVGLSTPEDVRTLALSLARKAHARLDDACPIVDGELDDDIRLHAAISPVAAAGSGALISLRPHPEQHYTLQDLHQAGMINDVFFDKLKKAVWQKRNVIISGATSSGKTTLMCALVGEVATQERIVVVEEAREISQKIHPNTVHIAARKPNTEGQGEVNLAQLIKATLRMRPDRIVLGECRGDEVREFLLVLGSGYSGSFATVHANSAVDVPQRLQVLAQMSGVSQEVAKTQVDKFLDVIVHIERIDGQRTVTQIVESNACANVNTPYNTWHSAEDST